MKRFPTQIRMKSHGKTAFSNDLAHQRPSPKCYCSSITRPIVTSESFPFYIARYHDRLHDFRVMMFIIIKLKFTIQKDLWCFGRLTTWILGDLQCANSNCWIIFTERRASTYSRVLSPVGGLFLRFLRGIFIPSTLHGSRAPLFRTLNNSNHVA